MKTVSFRSLLKIPELSDLTEYQLLHPCLDKLVYHYLALLAVDVEYPVEYFYCNHRDLDDVVGFGFCARGETSCNRLDINGPFSSMTDRLVASNYRDSSLTEQLAELSGKSIDYLQHVPTVIDENPWRYVDDVLEDDWQKNEKLIAKMNQLIIDIRGSAYNDSGSLRSAEEYQNKESDDGTV